MHTHQQYMHRCIHLARLGMGYTSPNPMVGAVLVYNDTIIGEGWHQKYGEPHAEVNCINSVPQHLQHLIPQATMYVSLEPCAHYGKTPPCASLIIEKQIPKVVIGCVDTYSEVSGKGIQMLQDAGVDVTLGILEEECTALNKAFFTYHHKKRPYIFLKWASSKDGFIAPKTEHPARISNEYTRLLLHKWRGSIDAFVVGFNTVVHDNPQLSNRHWGNQKQPVRVIIDPQNELPCKSNIFDGELHTLIYNHHFEMDGEMTRWIKLPPDNFLPNIIADLYKRGVTSLMVEGGSKTLQQFINGGLYDEIIIFQSPDSLGAGIAAPVFQPSEQSEQFALQDNSVHTFLYDNN